MLTNEKCSRLGGYHCPSGHPFMYRKTSGTGGLVSRRGNRIFAGWIINSINEASSGNVS
jgi:hypothetical protein